MKRPKEHIKQSVKVCLHELLGVPIKTTIRPSYTKWLKEHDEVNEQLSDIISRTEYLLDFVTVVPPQRGVFLRGSIENTAEATSGTDASLRRTTANEFEHL